MKNYFLKRQLLKKIYSNYFSRNAEYRSEVLQNIENIPLMFFESKRDYANKLINGLLKHNDTQAIKLVIDVFGFKDIDFGLDLKTMQKPPETQIKEVLYFEGKASVTYMADYYEKRKPYSSRESGTRVQDIVDGEGNVISIDYWKAYSKTEILKGVTCNLSKKESQHGDASFFSAVLKVRVDESANLPVKIEIKDIYDYASHGTPYRGSSSKSVFYVIVKKKGN